MEYKGRRQLSHTDLSQRHAPSHMDQLAFKYMDMCKVESSTDSESEISPRWSDTSTMGCSSSTPESRTLCSTLPLTQKPAVKHGCYSLFLDPYDGSSEDSDESNIEGCILSRRSRHQGGRGGGGGGGGSRLFCRSRRYILHHSASVALREVMKSGMRNPVNEQQHLGDVQMKCDSSLWVCELDIDTDSCRDLGDKTAVDSTTPSQAMDMELHCQFDDSSSHSTTSSAPQTPAPAPSGDRMVSQIPDRSPGPWNLKSLYKRKLGLPAAEVTEQRKRLCVSNMEDFAREPR